MNWNLDQIEDAELKILQILDKNLLFLLKGGYNPPTGDLKNGGTVIKKGVLTDGKPIPPFAGECPPPGGACFSVVLL